jgi:hypothetical protein
MRNHAQQSRCVRQPELSTHEQLTQGLADSGVIWPEEGVCPELIPQQAGHGGNALHPANRQSMALRAVRKKISASVRAASRRSRVWLALWLPGSNAQVPTSTSGRAAATGDAKPGLAAELCVQFNCNTGACAVHRLPV